MSRARAQGGGGAALKDPRWQVSVAEMQCEKHSRKEPDFCPNCASGVDHLSLNLPGLHLHMRITVMSD